MLARYLIDVMLGTGDWQAEEVADPANCRLQQWLDEDAAAEFGASAEFGEIGTLHAQVHELAQEVLRLYEGADAGAALAALSAFSEANGRLCRCLNEVCEQS